MSSTAKPLSARFLAAYNQLDGFMRMKLVQGPEVPHKRLIAAMAARESDFLHRENDLETFARLRNALVHNPYQPAIDPIAEPHERVVAEYERIVQRLLNPPSCLTIAIPVSAVFATDWETPVLKVIEVMNGKVYTHVPVLSDGRIVGVFSENTLFSYLAARGKATFDEATSISEFHDYVDVRNHASEVFKFLPPTATVVHLEHAFRDTFKLRQRLAAVFITDDGEETGCLLGLVTPWDIAGINSY